MERQNFNTISIYLKEDGSCGKFDKNFNLYQGSYQNALLKFYVPNSILPPLSISSNTVYAVSTFTKGYDRAGKVVNSRVYNVPFKEMGIFRGVEYSLFEMFLPQEFAQHSGTSTMVFNVVNISLDNNEVSEITTSQELSYQVLPSGRLQAPPLEPSDVEKLQGQINAHTNDINGLNEKVGTGTLETDNKQIIGAINEVNGKANSNKTQIDINTEEIADLKDASLTGRYYVGTISEPYAPSYPYSQETIKKLNDFVLLKAQRPAQDGDYIEWEYQLDDGTINLYVIAYGTQWEKPDLRSPSLPAQNNRFGVIKGGKQGEDGAKLGTDINNGVINDVLYDGLSVGTWIGGLQNHFDHIEDGGIKVGHALKADADGEGNNIIETYANKDNVWSKSQSDDRYLLNSFSEVDYYSNKGFVKDIPTDIEPQFSITTSVGGNAMFNISKSLEQDYTFSTNSSDSSTLWIVADKDCSLNFEMTTLCKKPQDRYSTLLVKELTGSISLTAGTFTKIRFNANYENLQNIGSGVVEFKKGSTFTKILNINADTSGIGVKLYSNQTYPSSFTFATQAITFNVNYINGKTKVDITSDMWQRGKVTIPQSVHKLAPSNEYGIEVQVVDSNSNIATRVITSPTINESGDITLYSDEPYTCSVLIYTAVKVQDLFAECGYHDNEVVTLDIEDNMLYEFSGIITDISVKVGNQPPQTAENTNRLMVLKKGTLLSGSANDWADSIVVEDGLKIVLNCTIKGHIKVSEVR